MCGGVSNSRRIISRKETDYLDVLVRGAYAKHDLEAGYVLTKESFEKDFYLAIPLFKGQLSCREVMTGERLTHPLMADERLTIDHIDGPYNENPALKRMIFDRGM